MSDPVHPAVQNVAHAICSEQQPQINADVWWRMYEPAARAAIAAFVKADPSLLTAGAYAARWYAYNRLVDGEDHDDEEQVACAMRAIGVAALGDQP